MFKVLSLFLPIAIAEIFSVDRASNRIVDSSGRQRIFHGSNVVYKTTPFIPITTKFDARYSFSEEDADLMASMGYNTIRLGVLWAGLEPTRGEYNMTYMAQVEEIVRIAGERGILSVLDMHQDVFNRKYCGNGVPDWAAHPKKENFPYPLEVEYEVDENNYPSRDDCGKIQWPNYHFSHSLSESVGRLYDNYEGLLDQFALFWGEVARTFAGNEHVLGYEIMNEPWCGDVYEDPTLLVPGVADRRYLQPMYDLVNTEIRKHDQEHLVLFESVTWEIVGIGEQFGFTHSPGGEDWANKSVLSFHNSVQDQVTSHADYYDLRWGEIKRLGIAGFVTETGDCCLDLADEISKWGFSWHHWAYKLYGDWTWDSHGLWNLGDDDNYDCPTVESCLNWERAKYFARVYPEALNGQGRYFNFDDTTSEAVLVFQPSGTFEASLVKVPVAFRYPNGFQVSIAPEGVAEWKLVCADPATCSIQDGSTISLTTLANWDGEELTVVISPANY